MRKFSKFITTLACLSTLTACPSNGDGDGDGTDETTETGTDETTETGTESSTTGDGDGDTTGDGDGDTTGDGDGDTTGDGDGDTTGDGDGDAAASCAAACEVFATCAMEGTLEECLSECNLSFQETDESCHPAAIDFYNCIGGLDCEGFDAFIEEATSDFPCAEEQAAIEDCDSGGVSSESGDPDPTGGSEPPDPTGGDSDPNP